MASKTWFVAFATLAACAGPTETTSSPARADVPTATTASAQPSEVVPTPCDPLADREEPYPLTPFGFAGRATDGTIYAIDGTDFDVRVLVSNEGVLRQHRVTKTKPGSETDNELEWDLDDGATRLYITRVLMNGDFRHIPHAISRADHEEALTPLTADEKAKLDVRRRVVTDIEGKAIAADGSRFMLIEHTFLFSPSELRAFYGAPPTLTERRIVALQNVGLDRSITLEVDGSTIDVEYPAAGLTPAVPGSSPDPDRSHGFANGLSFLCR